MDIQAKLRGILSGKAQAKAEADKAKAAAAAPKTAKLTHLFGHHTSPKAAASSGRGSGSGESVGGAGVKRSEAPGGSAAGAETASKKRSRPDDGGADDAAAVGAGGGAGAGAGAGSGSASGLAAGGGTSTGPEEPSAAKKCRVVDVSGALAKLKKHMGSDKKFVKAAGLLTRLVDHDLSGACASSFFDTLQVVMTPRDRVHADWARDAFEKLFTAVGKKLDCFTEAQRPFVDAWILAAVTHNRLFTDDPFIFSKAAAVVRKAVPAMKSGDAPGVVVHRAVVHDALGQLYRAYKRTWARSTVDSVYREAAKQRHAFTAAQQEEFDKWNNMLVARKRGGVAGIGQGGGIIAPSGRNTSGVVKAQTGGFVHPLFNRPHLRR